MILKECFVNSSFDLEDSASQFANQWLAKTVTDVAKERSMFQFLQPLSKKKYRSVIQDPFIVNLKQERVF